MWRAALLLLFLSALSIVFFSGLSYGSERDEAFRRRVADWSPALERELSQLLERIAGQDSSQRIDAADQLFKWTSKALERAYGPRAPIDERQKDNLHETIQVDVVCKLLRVGKTTSDTSLSRTCFHAISYIIAGEAGSIRDYRQPGNDHLTSSQILIWKSFFVNTLIPELQELVASSPDDALKFAYIVQALGGALSFQAPSVADDTIRETLLSLATSLSTTTPTVNQPQLTKNTSPPEISTRTYVQIKAFQEVLDLAPARQRNDLAQPLRDENLKNVVLLSMDDSSNVRFEAAMYVFRYAWGLEPAIAVLANHEILVRIRRQAARIAFEILCERSENDLYRPTANDLEAILAGLESGDRAVSATAARILEFVDVSKVETLSTESIVSRIDESISSTLNGGGVSDEGLESILKFLDRTATHANYGELLAIQKTVARIQEMPSRDLKRRSKSILAQVGERLEENRPSWEQFKSFITNLGEVLLYLLIVAAIVVIVVWWPVLALLLWKTPLAILAAERRLSFFKGVAVPKVLVAGHDVSLFALLMPPFIRRQERILDAWVVRHMEVAGRVVRREGFCCIPIRVEHGDAEIVSRDLSDRTLAKALRDQLAENVRSRILISGPGGSGKTRLGLQIADWVTSSVTWDALAVRRMIPILIEDDIIAVATSKAGKAWTKAWTKAVRSQVEETCRQSISPEFVKSLLDARRVLVVVDGLSEKNPEMQKSIQIADPDFPLRDVVVTSRNEDQITGVSALRLQLDRLRDDGLDDFVSDYLNALEETQTPGNENISDQVRKNLSDPMADDHRHGVTALQATTHVDALITEAKWTEGYQDAHDIPILLDQWLNELNEAVDVEHREEFQLVQEGIAAIARDGLDEHFRETALDLDGMERLKSFGEHEKWVDYFQRELTIVKRAGDYYDFVFPFVRHFAARHHVVQHGNELATWTSFLESIGGTEWRTDSVRQFFRAVQEIMVASSVNSRIADHVSRRIGEYLGSV